jgi:hypothetical protein
MLCLNRREICPRPSGDAESAAVSISRRSCELKNSRYPMIRVWFFSLADVCLGKPFQPERKLACDIQNKAKAPAMISELDRSCNWDHKSRPAIATRINSLSSLLLENIGSPTKQWFADNLRLLPLQPTTPSTKVESSAYPEAMLT